ncbi:hypothetical protein HG530_008198 [Fusarium avenaceum]|nr:hypothetical protein HG530_008198 [Fusarium avenaceum]
MDLIITFTDLAEVLALEHTDETLGGVINTLGGKELSLDTAVGEPLLEVLLVLLGVSRAELGVGDEEALHFDLLGDEVDETLDSGALVGGGVVLGDETTDGDSSADVDVGESSLEVVTTDVLEVDVDTVRGEAGEGVLGALLLVVETVVEAELLGDEVELSIVTDGSDNSETLTLGDLTDDLANSTSGRADEDGLALLGLTDLVKTRPGGETGHTQRSKEETEVEVVRVLDLSQVDLGDSLLVQTDVLGDGEETNDEVTLGEVRVVALDNLAQAAVHDSIVDLESGSVGLDGCVAHLAAQVRVERGIEKLNDETALGSLLDIDGTVLDDKMLTGHGKASGDLLVNESLVLCHICGCPHQSGTTLGRGSLRLISCWELHTSGDVTKSGYDVMDGDTLSI